MAENNTEILNVVKKLNIENYKKYLFFNNSYFLIKLSQRFCALNKYLNPSIILKKNAFRDQFLWHKKLGSILIPDMPLR